MRIASPEQFPEDTHLYDSRVLSHYILGQCKDSVPIEIDKIRIAVEGFIGLDECGSFRKPDIVPITQETRICAMHLFLHCILQIGRHLPPDLPDILLIEGVFH